MLTVTALQSARRPWWKRKRWWAAAALWLVVGYVASIGPLAYSQVRGWLPEWVVAPLLLPCRMTATVPYLADRVDRYMRTWVVRALEDEGYVVDVDPYGTVRASNSTILGDSTTELEAKVRAIGAERRQAARPHQH